MNHVVFTGSVWQCVSVMLAVYFGSMLVSAVVRALIKRRWK